MPTTAEILVNRIVSQWERQRQAPDVAGPDELWQSPMLTFSREEGGRQGLRIAQLVAERLGFELYDKRLVEKIAESAQVRETLVRTVDERTLDMISEYISSQFAQGSFTASCYLEHLSKTVLALGKHGKCIIVGRGAHFILDPQWTLRVRLVAPLLVRIQQMAADHGLSEREARLHIMSVDEERRAFCKQHYNQDVTQPQHYDLVLNYATLPLEMCAEQILASFERKCAPG